MLQDEQLRVSILIQYTFLVLRVLIGTGNYPKLSESYIEAEIQFLRRKGIAVAVWSDKVGSPGAPELVDVFRGTVTDAIAKWKPDVFHAHYLTFAGWAFDQARNAGVPCTVRGHSFDHGVDRARALAQRPEIKRIWLFPHFARQVAHPKVFALPVAYDSTLYKPGEKKIRRWVYRTAAGKPKKGLEDFFVINSLCADFQFELTANNVLGDEAYLPYLEKTAKENGVEFSKDISREVAVEKMKRAGIYLDTSDPSGHPFGMPISIAEALATGCYVLAREAPGLDEYLGNAGATYRTVSDAQGLILGTRTWTEEMWKDVTERAILQATFFADEAVLPAEIQFWESLKAGVSA